jgi:hypothetical protein
MPFDSIDEGYEMNADEVAINIYTSAWQILLATS